MKTSKYLPMIFFLFFAVVNLVKFYQSQNRLDEIYYSIWYWGFVWQAYINQPKETKQ